eukprot:gene5498-6184_t
MVAFICDACGQTIKKNKVEKHYLNECRNCSVLSCIDCGKDFHGDEYGSHNSCISEAEKYQGKLYRPKEKANKGETKQQEWIKQVQKASSNIEDPKLRQYLLKISEYSNVPRKKGKFLNFCKNSLRVYNDKILEKLWEAFEMQEKGHNQTSDVSNGSESQCEPVNGASNSDDRIGVKQQPNGSDNEINGTRKRKTQHETFMESEDSEKDNKSKKQKKEKLTEYEIQENLNGLDEKVEENDTEKHGKFKWHKAIKEILRKVGEEGISSKKLRKKVFISLHTIHIPYL